MTFCYFKGESIAEENPVQEVTEPGDTVTAEPNDIGNGDVMDVVSVLLDTMEVGDSLTKTSVVHLWYFSVGVGAQSINSGFIYNYYFTQRLALDINLYGALVGSYFEGEHCNTHPFHGLSGLTLGISYRF